MSETTEKVSWSKVLTKTGYRSTLRFKQVSYPRLSFMNSHVNQHVRSASARCGQSAQRFLLAFRLFRELRPPLYRCLACLSCMSLTLTLTYLLARFLIRIIPSSMTSNEEAESELRAYSACSYPIELQWHVNGVRM